MTTNTIHHGDAAVVLSELPSNTIDCVITSPPYFQLRNYNEPAQLGLEPTVEQWVADLRSVFAQLARVLKQTGSVWLNLGDSYSRHQRHGAPAKSLLLAPERLLIALAADGWIVRNKVIWAKTNPMPASVRDRLNTTHEYVYFLTRSPAYFFDLDTIRIPATTTGAHRTATKAVYPPPSNAPPSWAGPGAGNNAGLAQLKHTGRSSHPLGKNPGDVWPLATAAFRGAHFATFPKDLTTRPLLATCPERVCATCGIPWQRTRTLGHLATRRRLHAQCQCDGQWKPGLVLDPFMGSGTVALAAQTHNRRWLGIELNADYRDLALRRIAEDQPSTTNERKHHESPHPRRR